MAWSEHQHSCWHNKQKRRWHEHCRRCGCFYRNWSKRKTIRCSKDFTIMAMAYLASCWGSRQLPMSHALRCSDGSSLLSCSRYRPHSRRQLFQYSNDAAATADVTNFPRPLMNPSMSGTMTIDQRPTCCQHVFDLQLPEGRCVGLQMQDVVDPILSLDAACVQNSNHWLWNLLHADEIQFGLRQRCDAARVSFWLGRLALRHALLPRSTMENGLLKDVHGRPQVPDGFLGSISHKKNIGVALVTRDNTAMALPLAWGIGVDLELVSTERASIARRILTANEIDRLGQLEGITADEEVLLRFGLKECLYKSIHPLICQYVGFQEAEVHPGADGTASVTWALESGAHEKFGVVTAHWRKVRAPSQDYFLSSSSVRLVEGAIATGCEI